MEKNILWDQDHTLLRGVDNKIEVNHSVGMRLNEQSTYRNFFFSSKAEWATWEKADIAGIKHYFVEAFDSRYIQGSKSILPFKSWLGCDVTDLVKHSVYIGDNLDNDLVVDAPGLVHIIDFNAIYHDICIYFKILEYLQGLSNKSFSKGFEIGFQNKDVGYTVVDGIQFLLQPLKLRNVFAARSNWEDYEHEPIEGKAYVIMVGSVDQKYNVTLDEFKT